MSGHSGYPADSPLGIEAQRFLDSHPIGAAQPHMYNWNGGCGAEQMRYGCGALPTVGSCDVNCERSWKHSQNKLEAVTCRWLRSELAAAEAAGDCVLVATHHQVGQGEGVRGICAGMMHW